MEHTLRFIYVFLQLAFNQRLSQKIVAFHKISIQLDRSSCIGHCVVVLLQLNVAQSSISKVGCHRWTFNLCQLKVYDRCCVFLYCFYDQGD